MLFMSTNYVTYINIGLFLQLQVLLCLGGIFLSFGYLKVTLKLKKNVCLPNLAIFFFFFFLNVLCQDKKNPT